MKKVFLLGISLLLFSCSKSDEVQNSKNAARISQPSTLKYKLVSNMIKNYKTNQLTAIQNANINGLQNDAQAIWFDIETLKKYIADVESTTQENSENMNHSLGIRFYYAAYPEKEKWGNADYEELSDLMNDPITQLYEKNIL